jgi:hypothetical protein
MIVLVVVQDYFRLCETAVSPHLTYGSSENLSGSVIVGVRCG